jgi:hypothetical protein
MREKIVDKKILCIYICNSLIKTEQLLQLDLSSKQKHRMIFVHRGRINSTDVNSSKNIDNTIQYSILL